MAALLRSGKFLRLVSGLSRNAPLSEGYSSSSSAFPAPQIQTETHEGIRGWNPMGLKPKSVEKKDEGRGGGTEEGSYGGGDLIPVIQFLDHSTGALQIQPLEAACESLYMEGRVWDLENLVYCSSDYASPRDRETLFLYALKSFLSSNLYNKAVDLSNYLVLRGMDFAEFRDIFNNAFFYPPPPPPPLVNLPLEDSRTYRKQQSQTPLEEAFRRLKKSLGSRENLEEGVKAFRFLESKGKPLSVMESSSLIECLVKADMVSEATEVAETMLNRNSNPLPKIFRFLLNKLATSGSIDSMLSIGSRLSPKTKKEVSFDNRLCNAYLAVGKGESFLDALKKEFDSATEETLAIVQEKFPRGGAMGLLESEPGLLKKYRDLAEGYVKTGYIAPMNVLWAYYFINGKYDEAKEVWDAYLAPSSQIMFQKVCQTARAKNDVSLAQKLVELLYEAKVSPRAQGIAYSCLLDVYSQKGEYDVGLKTLESSLERGVKLPDINRTALIRLKNGLEEKGIKCSFEIPKKSAPSQVYDEDGIVD